MSQENSTPEVSNNAESLQEVSSSSETQQTSLPEDSPGENEGFAAFVERMEAKKKQSEQPKESKQEQQEEKIEEKKQSIEQPKTIKYKVDGEEIEVSLDKVPQLLSKAAGADKRFQEAAQIRSEAKEFVNFIKTNPIEALTRAGIDFEQIAIDYVHEMVQVQNMSPEQREAYEIKKENEKLKKQQQERDSLTEKQKKQQEEQELQQLTEQYIEKIEQGVISAMEKASHLPRSRVVADRFLHYYKLAMEQGVEASMEDLIPYVEKDFEFQIRQNRVEEYKKQEKQQQQASKKQEPKAKSKRITSIYDLLD